MSCGTAERSAAVLVLDLDRAGREHVRRLEAAVRASLADGPAVEEDDDPRPGLLALAERLEEREAEAFARLRADWLAGAADAFFEAVTAVGKRIANRPACVAEIERRFLLSRVPATARAFARQEIEQGWLPGLRVVERVTTPRTRPARRRPCARAAPPPVRRRRARRRGRPRPLRGDLAAHRGPPRAEAASHRAGLRPAVGDRRVSGSRPGAARGRSRPRRGIGRAPRMARVLRPARGDRRA